MQLSKQELSTLRFALSIAVGADLTEEDRVKMKDLYDRLCSEETSDEGGVEPWPMPTPLPDCPALPQDGSLQNGCKLLPEWP